MKEEKYIETENGKVFYWKSAGSSDLPTLVLLHGLSSNHTTWDSTVSDMSAKGYPTIVPDLRGHGHSDKSRIRGNYKIEFMREDVEKILAQEKVATSVLVGYSYGGMIGLDYAIHHPDKVSGLVLISTNHKSPFDYSRFPFMTPIARFMVNLFGWLIIWQKRAKYHYFNPQKTHGYWKTTFFGYATMPISINLWMLSQVFAHDYSDELAKITCPVLMIRGEDDTFVSDREAREMQAKIGNSRVAALGFGHYIAVHYQDLCTKEIGKFLTELA